MESNVVTFIVDNIFFFLPLGVIGIVATLYLYFTAKKDGSEIKDDLEADYIVVSKYSLNVYVLIYLFIFVMMMIMGLLSYESKIPVIVGGILALIPIIAFYLVKIINTRSKEL